MRGKGRKTKISGVSGREGVRFISASLALRVNESETKQDYLIAQS